MSLNTDYPVIDKDTLLDRFPFQEDELDHLLTLFPEDGKNEVVIIPKCSITESIERVLPKDCVSALVTESIASSSSSLCTTTPLHQFLEGLSVVLGRRGPRPVLDVLWNTCQAAAAAAADPIQKDFIMDWIYRIARASQIAQTREIPPEEEENHAHACSSSSSSFPKEWKLVDVSSKPQFMDWANSTLPQLYTAVASIVHCIFLEDFDAGKTPFLCLPQLNKPSDLPLDTVSLGLLSAKFQGSWRRLYNNLEDGSSFEILQRALIGYQGPTTMIVQTTRNEVFGYFTECPWKTSPKWFGIPGSSLSHFYDNADSFLFTLAPQFKILAATGQGKYYQYLYIPPSHRPTELKGLCIGGIASNCPRIHLTTDFTHCKATSIDTTYENGSVLDEGNHFFDVCRMEVYATSVADAVYQRNQRQGQLQADIQESHRIHNAKVDKVPFLEDFTSDFHVNKTFAHRDTVQVRCELKDDANIEGS
jgi:hypothetical protein